MTNLTRRALVRTAASGAAFGLAGPLTALPAAAARRGDGFFTYRVGDVRCTALYDGIWHKSHDDGFIRNATVAETKGALTKAGLSDGAVPIEFTQTLLEVGGRRILIDPGTGGQWVPTAGTMLQSLERAGFGPRDIDTVLISHFHPDHIFGLMREGTDAQVFPDSEILVPEAEYAFGPIPVSSRAFHRRGTGSRGASRRRSRTGPTSRASPPAAR